MLGCFILFRYASKEQCFHLETNIIPQRGKLNFCSSIYDHTLQMDKVFHCRVLLQGHGKRPIFWGFCINRFGIGLLHYISSRSDFDFEFAEIFVIEKRLPDSLSQGVDKNAYRYKCFQTFESINGVSTLQPRLIFG